VDTPITFVVAAVVLILIFGQAYVWRRGVEKRRADGSLGKPTRLTHGAWIVIVFVAVFFGIFVVVMPLLEG
jgi:dolichyl-phosphate-mannose--protein O-mannosyl transferase